MVWEDYVVGHFESLKHIEGVNDTEVVPVGEIFWRCKTGAETFFDAANQNDIVDKHLEVRGSDY